MLTLRSGAVQRVLNHHGEGNLIIVFAIGVRCTEVDFGGPYFADVDDSVAALLCCMGMVGLSL